MSRVAVAGFRGAAGRSAGTPPGGGPPVLVNQYSANTTTDATTNTVTGVSAAAGQIMVLAAALKVGNTTRVITGVTDPGSNTWTKQQAITGVAGNATRSEIWTAPVTGALSSGTVTISSGAQVISGNFDVSVWSGVTLTGVLGTTAGGIGTTSSTATLSPTGAAALVAVASYSLESAPTAGPDGGFTTLAGAPGSAGSLHYGTSAYRIVSTGGTYGTVWTATTSTNWGVAIVALPSL